MDYQVTAENSTENSSVQVLHITRKLDTGDPQDVPITVGYLSIQTGVGGLLYPPKSLQFLPFLGLLPPWYRYPSYNFAISFAAHTYIAYVGEYPWGFYHRRTGQLNFTRE